MMRGFFIALVGLMIITITTVSAQEMETLLDLSDTGVQDFSLPVQDGQLAISQSMTLLPIYGATDAVIKYRVKINGEGLVELLLRYDYETDDYYAFRVDTRKVGGDPPGFLKRNHGEPPWPLVGERTGGTPLPDTWVNVRIEMFGDELRGYVDGQLVATLTDPDYKAGGFAVRSQLNDGVIDGLQIQVPKGEKAGVLKPRAMEVVAPEPYTEGIWTADWIWSPGPDNELARVLRKHFTVSGPMHEATVVVTCDNSYELALNGTRLGGDTDWYAPEAYDVSKLLRPGDNVLAVLARNSESGSAGLLLELGGITETGEYINVISDDTWKVNSQVPEDWAAEGLDDSAWGNAVSQGKHPLQPWAGQSPLTIPYIGPKQNVELVRVDAPTTVRFGEAIVLTATWRPQQELTSAYPVVLQVSQNGGAPMDIAMLPPQIPTTHWPVGKDHTETFQIPLLPDVAYLLTSGKVTLGLDLRGTIYTNQRGTAVAVCDYEPAPLATGTASSRLAIPVRSGVFVDLAGVSHEWSVDNEGRIVVDGVAYLPLDEDGVYWCEAATAGDALAALDWKETVRRICRQGGPAGADFVRVKLVDHIDATLTDHEFSEDGGFGGKSRVMTLGDRDYRVTSARPRLSYFAYTATCEHPRNPHLMMFQSVNDAERYTTLRIQPPWDSVGGGAYTGREFTLDGKPFEHRFIFYPRARKVRFTVSRMPVESEIKPDSGGAVSHVWMFELMNPLAAVPVRASAPAEETRRLGIYLTHPAYITSLYGYRGDTPAERLASVKSFVDYLKFCGINLLEFNAVDGGDTTGTAYYPSNIWSNAPGNLLADLLPVCEANDIQVIPIITSLSVPEGKEGFTKDSMQMDRYGNPTVFFNSRPPLPDPLRPEVQDLLIRNLKEILDLCAQSKAVPAVGFRVNGKIGLCYGGETLGKSDQYSGYSPWDVAEFEKDSGIDVPQMQPTPYEWIRANCWEQWLDWRCQRNRDLWLRCRDTVREYRDDLKLYISCDMPSETPAWNIYWPEGETPLNCWRYHGVDPHLVANEPGILIQRGMMVAADRYFTRVGQYGTNVEALKTFHYAPGVTELYDGREGAACELYYNYWEEVGVFKQGEFGTDFWGAATMQPFGRNYFEPIAFSLAKTNCHTLNVFSWERGTFGHEHDLRAFSRAFRALPRGDGVDATARVDGDISGLWVRQFGNRLALLNQTSEAQSVVVRVALPPADKQLVEFARDVILQPTAAPTGVEGSLRLELKPYELRVLGER